jgi:hypothetical protein
LKKLKTGLTSFDPPDRTNMAEGLYVHLRSRSIEEFFKVHDTQVFILPDAYDELLGTKEKTGGAGDRCFPLTSQERTSRVRDDGQETSSIILLRRHQEGVTSEIQAAPRNPASNFQPNGGRKGGA